MGWAKYLEDIASRHNGTSLVQNQFQKEDRTFQLIKDTTPSTALELNHNGGNVRYGWRVKASLVTTYVLAEYTTFWHHQNGKCYDAAGWIPNPDQDTGNGNSSIANRAAGSQDPVGGVNGLGGTGGGHRE